MGSLSDRGGVRVGASKGGGRRGKSGRRDPSSDGSVKVGPRRSFRGIGGQGWRKDPSLLVLGHRGVRVGAESPRHSKQATDGCGWVQSPQRCGGWCNEQWGRC